jgi:hypothetical protein
MPIVPRFRRLATLTVGLSALFAVAVLLSGCLGEWFSRDNAGKVEAAAPQEQSSVRPTTSAPTPAPPAKPVTVFDNGNPIAIHAGGKAPTFKLSTAATITTMTSYHYIVGGGPSPGTLGLKSADGTMYGPWQCKGADGQGGVKNAFWIAEPNADVPAGTYTIVDSDPSTWSTNSKAGGLGFATVNVIPK